MHILQAVVPPFLQGGWSHIVTSESPSLERILLLHVNHRKDKIIIFKDKMHIFLLKVHKINISTLGDIHVTIKFPPHSELFVTI